MRIIHSGEKEGEGKGSILLSDRSGGYLWLPNEDVNRSNYQGWYTFDYENWSLYKTIENIYIEDKEVNTVHNKFSHVDRDSGPVTERFYLDEKALLYETHNYDGFVSVDFDFRHVYDFDKDGRIYEIKPREGGLLIVRYKKYSDRALQELEHERYMAIKNVKDYWMSGDWQPRCYDYDKERNSKCEFFIYGTLKLKVSGDDKLVFATGKSEEEAVEKTNSVWHNSQRFKDDLDRKSEREVWSDDAVFNTASNSLYSLLVDLENDERGSGIFAGYPWFFQFWRRDELISLKGLMLLHEDVKVKKLLMNHLHRIREDGWFDNRNVESDLESADATGWLFTRFHDFMKRLENKEGVYDMFMKEELHKIMNRLDEVINATREYHENNGFIVNDKLETWMDTFVDEDFREGARIEIQALQLRMYEFAKYLAEMLGEDGERYEGMIEELANKVRENFFDGEKLADGVVGGEVDWTQRPNVFLACYVYPGLFSDEEWERIFDNALEHLWLDWGGLASISKDNELFTEEYTGETNESYHRGDSWYWINNIAAMCMKRLNEEKYKDKIDKITEASKEEMLFHGALGHCSEVSSAKRRESKGCVAQAWSAATLLELLNS